MYDVEGFCFLCSFYGQNTSKTYEKPIACGEAVAGQGQLAAAVKGIDWEGIGMKILILTGRFGMGHMSAAESLKQQAQRQFPESQVTIVDFLEYLAPKLQKAIYNLFNLLVCKASPLYNLIYRNSPEQDDLGMLFELLLKKMQTLLEHECPDVVFSTLPLCTQVLSEHKRQTGCALPLVTCITDLCAHSDWVSPFCDLYLVATPAVKHALVEQGIRSQSIIVGGIPVRDAFLRMVTRKETTGPRAARILIMGGGLGLIPLEDGFFDFLSRQRGIHTVVIVGNNQKAQKELAKKHPNIEVVGFTQQVHEYMAQADLIITKAGGISTFEAIHARLPMLVVPPFLEQERWNAAFIQEHGLGEVLWDKHAPAALRAIELARNPRWQAQVRAKMDGFARSLSPNPIAQVARQLAEGFAA